MRNHVRNAAILLAAVSTMAIPVAAQNAARAVAKPDPAFAAQVRQVLLDHPEYIFEAAQVGQQRQRDQQQAEQSAKVASSRPVVLAKGFGPTIGNPDGTAVAAELLDYACPFCKRANVLVEKIAAENPKARFTIVMRPVLGPQSETLARFALASMLQNRFAQTHAALYEKFGDDHQTPSTDANLREVAQKAGVDFDRAKRDMTGDQVAAMLQKHQAAAEQMAVNGTPFFLTTSTVIPGAPRDEAQLKAAMGL